MTIEIVDFPIKNGGSFHSYVKLPEGSSNRAPMLWAGAFMDSTWWKTDCGSSMCRNPSILKKSNMLTEKKCQKRWYPLKIHFCLIETRRARISCSQMWKIPVVERQISLQLELENLARSKPYPTEPRQPWQPWALFLDAFFEAKKRGEHPMGWGLYTQIWSLV